MRFPPTGKKAVLPRIETDGLSMFEVKSEFLIERTVRERSK
jgi:hypothetical protein